MQVYGGRKAATIANLVIKMIGGDISTSTEDKMEAIHNKALSRNQRNMIFCRGINRWRKKAERKRRTPACTNHRKVIEKWRCLVWQSSGCMQKL
jgi:hypothetical protein